MQCPEKTVSTVINRHIKQHGNRFLMERAFPAPTGRAGRPAKSYSLNSKQVVTLPETAVILLELAKYSPTSPQRIRIDQFEAHVSAKFRLPLRFLRGRLKEAIKVGYIERPTDGHIWRSELIASERLFLALLAKEFNIKISGKRIPKTRRV
jgi:hypothetical protein